MLITKQYVVFGKTRMEIYNQMCMIKNEFFYTRWDIKSNHTNKEMFNLVVNKNNVQIHIYPCLIEHSRGIRWDNCWISGKISEEEINNIIMPMAIGDTPEIHFF